MATQRMRGPRPLAAALHQLTALCDELARIGVIDTITSSPGICRMSRTLGYHVVKSGYGLWLPGSERGSWSERWDHDIGYTEPHTLHPGDPIRRRMAEERMTHPPVRLTVNMMDVLTDELARCIADSQGDFAIGSAAIEPTHIHLLIPYSGRDINRTIKWISDRTTKAIHQRTTHAGPVWGKGRWRGYLFTPAAWQATDQYICRHNLRRGLPPRPYPFISPHTL